MIVRYLSPTRAFTEEGWKGGALSLSSTLDGLATGSGPPSPGSTIYIVSLAMTDDERVMDTGTAPSTDPFSHLEDYEQWFPSLTFDGYRVKRTRPTDYIETTVMQPVGSASTERSSRQGSAHDDPPSLPSSRGSASTHAGDTLWLQMNRRSSIRTTDGSVTLLAPRGDSRPVGSETERKRVAERKYERTVMRRKRTLTLMALASSIVTVASLVALTATIV